MSLLHFFNRRDNSPAGEMTFIDHLEELRWHIIRSVIAVIVCAILIFIKSDYVVTELIFGPTRPDFIAAKWLCSLGRQIGIGEALCFRPSKPNFQRPP
jgi:sec-independent protein translocase protein TatC